LFVRVSLRATSGYSCLSDELSGIPMVRERISFKTTTEENPQPFGLPLASIESAAHALV
jgi:hypothetical protein